MVDKFKAEKCGTEAVEALTETFDTEDQRFRLAAMVLALLNQRLVPLAFIIRLQSD